MKVIIVTGTPGTGKTTLAKNSAFGLNFLYLDVNRLISKSKLSEGYDKKRKTRIVDVDKLRKFLIFKIKNFQNENNKKKNSQRKFFGIIIDSHLSHYLPNKYVDLCIVTKCDIKELSKRLKKKRFHKEKIKENMQAEIFGICHNEALERKHNVIVIDTSKSKNLTGKNFNSIAVKIFHRLKQN